MLLSMYGGLSLCAVAVAAPTPLAFPGETVDAWHGFRRHRFEVDGCRAWVVEPGQPAAGLPWTWCMEFPDAFTERTGVLELLAAGYHHLHLEVGNTFGCPAALDHFDAFYEVVRGADLAPAGTLIGISRGGLYAYRWAARWPERAKVIYGDAPVCDFKSWPAGRGGGPGSPGDWAELIRCYGFGDEAEALAYRENPIDLLEPLAAAGVAIIHVVGEADEPVPPAENSDRVEARYRALGGEIVVIRKPDCGHHPHGLDDTAPVVRFIREHLEPGE